MMMLLLPLMMTPLPSPLPLLSSVLEEEEQGTGILQEHT